MLRAYVAVVISHVRRSVSDTLPLDALDLSTTATLDIFD